MEITSKLSPSISKTLSQTYGLLAAMVMVTALVSTTLVWAGFVLTNVTAAVVLMLVGFGLLFLTFSGNAVLALGALLSFSVIKGIILTTLVSVTSTGLLLTALILTFTIFASLSGYVLLTGKDFTGWGNYLLGALILLVLTMVVGIFVELPITQLAISWITLLLFSGFILYDTSSIVEGEETNPIVAALGLYLNLLNIFTSLINILKDD